MKIPLSVVPAFLALILVPPSNLLAQDNTTPSTPSKTTPNIDVGTGTPTTPSATQPEASSPLANLSKEDRTKFENIVRSVLDAYGQEDWETALARLAPADAMTPKNPDIMNLQGAIYIKQKKWDQANAEFNSVLAINPKYFPSRFNLGEVPFQQKKFADALAIFQNLLAEEPKSELLLYKIFLCYLFEPNLDQAQAYLNKFDAFGNSPAYYFANAAWLFNKQHPDEANSYIASSIRIYSPAANALFAEPLMDAGYIKRPAMAPAIKAATP